MYDSIRAQFVKPKPPLLEEPQRPAPPPVGDPADARNLHPTLGAWMPPETIDEIPLEKQKNKYYYQFRLAEMPEGELRKNPIMFFGVCRGSYDPDVDFAYQPDPFFCINL